MLYLFYSLSQSQHATTKRVKPQEYMAQLTISNYTETGNAKEKLQADYWEFIPSNGHSELVKPRVTIYKPNGEIWYLSANKALAWHTTINDQISKIDLQEGVIIERPAMNNATPTKIETLTLQYIPNEEKITSEEFVSMQQPGLTISGYGLLGFLDRNWVELHEKVTTVYIPNAH